MWCGSRMVVVLAVGLLLVGCETAAGPQVSASASVTPSSTSVTPQDGRDLAPSGLTLVGGGSGVLDMAADAAGSVWVTGSWQVARLDPRSGAAKLWTVADDLALARGWPATGAWPFEGTPGAGVWLVDHDRVLLFDGNRFTRELAVPKRFGIPAAVVGGGHQLWVETESVKLLEWDGAAWADRGRTFGPLVVDSGNALWSGRRQRQPDGSWVIPDRSRAPSESALNVTVADPAVGIWGVAQKKLYRYDGARWHRWSLPAIPGPPWPDAAGWTAGSMAITGGGEVWVAGDSGVVRRDKQGHWTTFTSKHGLSVTWPPGMPRQVVVVGGEVLVSDRTGVLRLNGRRFVPLWSDPAMADIGSVGCLHAVSRAQVWVSTPPTPSSRPSKPWKDGSLARFTDGSWELGQPAVSSCQGLAVGPEGEVWAITPKGLIRFDGKSWAKVDGSIKSGPLAVGPDGVAWAMSGARLVRFEPDGTRTVIGRTPLAVRRDSLLLSSAQPGVVWVGTSAWESQPQAARWSGRWSRIPGGAWTLQIRAAADGSLWAEASDNNDGWLIRYAGGRWSEVPDSRGRGINGSLVSSPTGGICTKGSDNTGGDAMTCYDAGGLTATVALPAMSAEVSIGSDGAVWVLGDQVARLPDHVLPWPMTAAG